MAGSSEIMDILVRLPRKVLLINLEHAIRVAINQDDQEWLFFIKMFIETKKIKITKYDFENEELYEAVIKNPYLC